MKLLENIFQDKFPIEKYSLTINGLQKRRIKTNRWSINPMIKSLYISEIYMNNCLSILSCTPQIQSLKTNLMFSSDPVEPISLVLNHLRKVHLHILCNQFIELLAFKTLAPNLESLSIDGYLSNRDENIFHEHMWNQLFTNLKHVQVNLQHSPTSSSVKTTLRDYIAKLYDKPWFSHYENEDFLIVFIKFKLVN